MARFALDTERNDLRGHSRTLVQCAIVCAESMRLYAERTIKTVHGDTQMSFTSLSVHHEAEHPRFPKTIFPVRKARSRTFGMDRSPTFQHEQCCRFYSKRLRPLTLAPPPRSQRWMQYGQYLHPEPTNMRVTESIRCVLGGIQ